MLCNVHWKLSFKHNFLCQFSNTPENTLFIKFLYVTKYLRMVSAELLAHGVVETYTKKSSKLFDWKFTKINSHKCICPHNWKKAEVERKCEVFIFRNLAMWADWEFPNYGRRGRKLLLRKEIMSLGRGTFLGKLSYLWNKIVWPKTIHLTSQNTLTCLI